MITGPIKGQIDQIWNAFSSGSERGRHLTWQFSQFFVIARPDAAPARCSPVAACCAIC